MWTGTIESIHIASAAEAPTQSVDQAQAIPGVGLEGDRYAKRQGTFFKPLPDFELTLIEAEAVEAIAIRGADVHAALHATPIAKACLEAEAGRSTEANPTGFARARRCKPICEMS